MSRPVLVLTPALLDEVRSRVNLAGREECCGVLLGCLDGDRRVVESVRLTRNAAAGDRRRRFRIDPAELAAVLHAARREGSELVGYYHSHPQGPAIPSRLDRLAAWPEASYLILAADGARSFRLESESAELVEEELILEELEMAP